MFRRWHADDLQELQIEEGLGVGWLDHHSSIGAASRPGDGDQGLVGPHQTGVRRHHRRRGVEQDEEVGLRGVLAQEIAVVGGGPAGGTFQVVANAIQVYDPIKKSDKYRVRAQSSAGSVENLRKVNKGRADFGVVYSGHVYLGREGRLKNDTNKYEDVLAVSYLYGAPAQLVVRKGSGITSTMR